MILNLNGTSFILNSNELVTHDENIRIDAWNSVRALLFLYLFLRLTVDFDRCFLEFQVSNRRNRHPEGSLLIFSLSPPHSCYHVSLLIFFHLGLCSPRRYRSICAARMYRALCEQGCLTEYAPYVQRKSNLSLSYLSSQVGFTLHRRRTSISELFPQISPQPTALQDGSRHNDAVGPDGG